jgi:hypothetical protein
MTYLQYCNQLVNEVRFTKANTQLMFENLKKGKCYPDHYEYRLYMKTVKDFHCLANQAEYVMRQILNGTVSLFDEID